MKRKEIKQVFWGTFDGLLVIENYIKPRLTPLFCGEGAIGQSPLIQQVRLVRPYLEDGGDDGESEEHRPHVHRSQHVVHAQNLHTTGICMVLVSDGISDHVRTCEEQQVLFDRKFQMYDLPSI